MSPDFEALRALRNAAMKDEIEAFARKLGWTGKEPLQTTFNPNDCYCNCVNGGPCEHSFEGWSESEDGRVGESVCSRCGMGAMGHSLRCGE